LRAYTSAQCLAQALIIERIFGGVHLHRATNE
jgi:hypothetical protein